MERKRIDVPEGAEGRADVFLAEKLCISRAAVQKLTAAGAVTESDRPVANNHRICSGEVYTVILPEEESNEPKAQDLPLVIRYEDEDVVVVDKAVGMVVYPAAGHRDGTLLNALAARYGESFFSVGEAGRGGIVHRIDKNTSGLLAVAKNTAAYSSLKVQLSLHTMAREYTAVCVGNLREDEGTIQGTVGRDPKNRKRMAANVPGGRPAVTHWRVTERWLGACLVVCRLETGRTHQIRVQMASIGHPLLGDTVYGSKKPVPGLAGQCLHAHLLRFRQPTTGEIITVTSPLPDAFVAVEERFRKK